jgi:hypothetical protein
MEPTTSTISTAAVSTVAAIPTTGATTGEEITQVGCVVVAAIVNAGGHAAQQALNQTSTQIAQLPTTQSNTRTQAKVGVPFVVNATWTNI